MTESQCRDRGQCGACLGQSPGLGGPRCRGKQPRQKHPLGRPCLRTGAFMPKCLPLPRTVCGTNSKSPRSHWTGVISQLGCPPPSTPPFVTDTCVGRTLSASHSFQVSSNPRTVLSRYAAWNNSAPHPERQYAETFRDPTRVPCHVEHPWASPGQVRPSPDVFK